MLYKVAASISKTLRKPAVRYTAIRKIDKETRQRFKDTFDQINVGFAELFPRVFGGGTACLEMTGDDLLDTGVKSGTSGAR